MNPHDSATIRRSVPTPAAGMALAFAGVLAFSLSFPATVWALDGFGPWSATGIRGLLAAAIASAALATLRSPAPRREDWPGLLVVALGCAVGFALLTTLALQTSSTAHSAVVIGALPMATAVISSLRTGSRPTTAFWVAASVGAATVVAFALVQNNGAPTVADLYLIGALLMCAAGYAEGGRLAVRMPGWRVIAWGLVLASPVNLLITCYAVPREPIDLTGQAVVGMLYIAGISQLGGFVVWYQGMARIGVARASQLQLAQPLLTLVWAVLLLGERLTPATPLAAAIVLACIVATQRARASSTVAPPSRVPVDEPPVTDRHLSRERG